ncbi:hypothetical protein VBQ50_06650 [Klebsiella pneumoniae]|uniref:hypothetical protein n=1 Tax=Klebsiella TaxID=570 RepID=UPI0029294686|nr:hypothetical protein [Klebsiella pneumoniae]MEA4729476.1 hypothetical protein [Klebsiella pneumoniae]MEB1800175.1 hypothetical protein [Klebsiella pneumoniae]HCK0402783.1 hypothetical protein [Klebsiella pneumoniae]HDH0279896.1 hypothetical protein [Klebsiella pneumoniae]
MKKLIVAVALLAPVAAQGNQWELVCAGVNLQVINAHDGNYIWKNKKMYVPVGGTTLQGWNTDIYARYLPDVSEYKSNNDVIPVDANDHITLDSEGADGGTHFRLVDSRGNHPCSVQSFKAGE